MIECPFCRESFDEEQIVYEFNWAEVSDFFYRKGKLANPPVDELKGKPFYIRIQYNWRGYPELASCSFYVNPAKHPGGGNVQLLDPNWRQLERVLSGKRMFEITVEKDSVNLPFTAKIHPMVREGKKNGRSLGYGFNSGTFCPHCEKQLRLELMKTVKEVRILLAGRPGSGKTVYITQAISQLMSGQAAPNITIEAANGSVQQHYDGNKNRLRPFQNKFVLATNPGEEQEPYVYIVKSIDGTECVRLIIQDVAGEDMENRNKYDTIVRNADMILYFVDPWHIEEMREFHRINNDPGNAVVERSVGSKYVSLSGVFLQMLSNVDRNFTEQSGQLAGVLLIKGDYLNPPMLSRGSQPECQMMAQPVMYSNGDEMELGFSLRSSFIRQNVHEWESTRIFAREVEGRYKASDIRYFVATALGQSTHLREAPKPVEQMNDVMDDDDPNEQFTINGASAPVASRNDEEWHYDDQMLEAAARPEHVIDPILWCLKRKGVKL